MRKPTKRAVLRRLRMFDAADDMAWFVIRGEYEEAYGNDVSIDIGPVETSWWDIPLPPCPDCGGDIVWWEAGYVPGARKCVGQPVRIVNDDPAYGDGKRRVYGVDGGCGSMFSVEVKTAEEEGA